jgi:hypothetical protein
VKWARVEGVFIGPESIGRSAKGAYVWYYYIAVQRLSCMSRYYPEDIPKSSVRLVLLAYVFCIIQSTAVLFT